MLYTDHPFSNSFCGRMVDDCLAAVAKGTVNLVAIPGVGVTFFVRQLAYRSADEFISVNSFEMHDFSKAALYNQLSRKLGLEPAHSDHVDLQAIGDALKQRATNDKKVVLVFNRFDRLGPLLDQSFYENLQFLGEVAGGKLVMMFVTAEPVIELAGPGLQDLLRLIDGTVYFPGYSQADLREIIKSSGTENIERKALGLSGGHHALLQILMRCQNLDNALSDPMVELLVKDMYLNLSPKRRKDIDAVAGGRAKPVDRFLTDVGYIVEDGAKRCTFTPLLSGYALRQAQSHLPVRERRLLSLLKRNVGRVVSKQDIFDAVWRESDGIATDWALNALVYRLRRHPAFDSQRYAIESHKKQGYVLREHQA